MTIPAPGTVDLWEIDLDRARGPEDLSRDERERAARFRFEKDRLRYVTGRSALRRILGDYLQTAPEGIVFRYGPAGKPEVDGVSFNLAHSGGHALLGVTSAGKIGVDIEEARELEDMVDTARVAFSPGEFARWERFGAELRRDLFYRIWTRKEAYLKATGEGIAERLHSFEVAFEPGEEPRILRGAEGEWTILDVSAGPGVIAGIAVEGNGIRIERRSFSM